MIFFVLTTVECRVGARPRCLVGRRLVSLLLPSECWNRKQGLSAGLLLRERPSEITDANPTVKHYSEREQQPLALLNTRATSGKIETWPFFRTCNLELDAIRQ
jgi:hypothetical protein